MTQNPFTFTSDVGEEEKVSSKSPKGRILALNDWVTSIGFSPTLSAALLNKIAQGTLSVARSYEGKLIERACTVIHALVASGGACVPSHIRLIERMTIDRSAADIGFIRWPQRQYRRPGSKSNTASGPRQFLYAQGRIHLKAYIALRLNGPAELRPQDGDLLLPRLSGDLLRKAAEDLAWLCGVRRRVNWTWVYKAWVKHQIAAIHECVSDKDFTEKATRTTLFAEMSLWQLLLYEPPLLLEARRGRLLTAPLPDSYLARLVTDHPVLHKDEIMERVSSTKTRIVRDQVSSSIDCLTALPYFIEEESYEYGPTEEIDELQDSDEELSDLKRQQNSAVKEIHSWLRSVVDQEKSKTKAIEEALSLLNGGLIQSAASNDLRLLLRWIIHRVNQTKKLKKRRWFGGIFTYSNRLLTLFKGFGHTPFAQLSTSDLAAFLDDYATANAAIGYRAAARCFHTFLVGEGLTSVDQFDWKSRSLHFSEGYRERALITEEEFRRVIEASYTYNDEFGHWIQPVLLLLRRAGLRCGEASFLTPNDFRGLVECRLRIRTSKTEAGKRTLPLYLLLNNDELETVLTFVESVRRERGSNAHLVTIPDGSKVEPDSLGRLIVKLFRAGGVYGETAHGLRHAFASGLLAAWWLRLTGRWPDTDSAMSQNWVRRALYSFGRPNVEGRAIEYADDIRRLLGHADLAVTFERYIHTLDIIAADAIQITEQISGPQLVSIPYAARLLCISERAVRYRFDLGERSAPLRGDRAMTVTLDQLEKWLSSRIHRAL